MSVKSMDYRKLAGRSFNDIENEFDDEDEEVIVFEKKKDFQRQNGINLKKNFKQDMKKD